MYRRRLQCSTNSWARLLQPCSYLYGLCTKSQAFGRPIEFGQKRGAVVIPVAVQKYFEVDSFHPITQSEKEKVKLCGHGK